MSQGHMQPTHHACMMHQYGRCTKGAELETEREEETKLKNCKNSSLRLELSSFEAMYDTSQYHS